MREPVTALYYPASTTEDLTLKKCILLFDEIHFMDRPAFMFGRFGMIGHESPLRPYAPDFRENGVPLYVHKAPGGPIGGQLLEQVQADVADVHFLKAVQEGLRTSLRFRELLIPRGNMGNGENHQTVAKKLCDLDLSSCRQSAWDVFSDESIKPFEFSSTEGIYKNFVYNAVQTSAVLNFALGTGEREGFRPIADASPYASLISAKFARAVAAEQSKPNIPFSDLSLAIFDALVSPEKLRSLTYGDIFKYRKETQAGREAFLEMLATFHAKAESPAADGDYQATIRSIVETEIRPAAREFRNKLETVHETLFGKIKESTLKWAGGSGLAHLLTGMPWDHVLMLGAALLAVETTSQISEAQRTKVAARRNCAISYVLDIETELN